MLTESKGENRRMTIICKTFAGCEPQVLGETEDFVPPSQENSVLISFHTSRRLRHDLERNRFTHVQEFSILPDRSQPRWLLPVKTSLMLSGLKLYVPFSIRGSLFKSLLTGMIRLGWKGQTSTKVLLASRKPLPLQALVSEVTGEKQPEFALSLGNVDQFHALVVQVMRPDGEILGYIKLPLTVAAVECVRNEAKVLDHLWESSSALHPHVPRVLHSGDWENDFILFQSGGPRKPGPPRFGKMHEDFLGLLQDVNFVEKPGCQLVEEFDRSWRCVEGSLDLEWRRVGQDALRTAGQLLGETKLRCGLIHGDFAPWNTRQQDGQLYVFDWESAKWQLPTMWDIFRFHERTSILLNEKQVRYPDDLKSPIERASFLLYCLHSVLEALEARGRHVDAKSQHYKDQILRCLSRPV